MFLLKLHTLHIGQRNALSHQLIKGRRQTLGVVLPSGYAKWPLSKEDRNHFNKLWRFRFSTVIPNGFIVEAVSSLPGGRIVFPSVLTTLKLFSVGLHLVRCQKCVGCGDLFASRFAFLFRTHTIPFLHSNRWMQIELRPHVRLFLFTFFYVRIVPPETFKSKHVTSV